MASLQRKTVDFDLTQQLPARPSSSGHGDDWFSNLSDAQWECFSTLCRNEATAEEIQVKKKVDAIIHDGTKSKDQDRKEIVHLKQELSVLNKKYRIQELDLRWGRKQKGALEQELEGVKKELQLMRQAAGEHRTQQHSLKDQLGKVVKERDGLQLKLLECKGESSELRDKLTNQQSALKSKESQCQEQMKQIHLLKLENEKLKKERDINKSEAEYKKQELRWCEEALQIQKRIPKKIVIVKGKSHVLLPKRRSKPVTVQDNESLKKELCRRNEELLSTTEELRETQQRGHDMKQSLTHVSVQLQQCKAQLREQSRKLMALTAERNMYRSEVERQKMESAEVTEQLRREKLQAKAAKRNKKAEKPPPGAISSRSQPTPISIIIQPQSALCVIPAAKNK